MNITQNNTSFGQTYCLKINRNQEPNPEGIYDFKELRADNKLYLTPREDDAKLKKYALKMAKILSNSNETIKEKSREIYEQLYNNELENALDITV